MFIMKKNIRKLYKNIRNSLNENEKFYFDECILTGFINSELMNYELYLIYVSFGSEINTLNLIDYLLKNQKRVAVPVCNEKNMVFYEIHSVDELKKGRFGILTVDENRTDNITDFAETVCVVPGLCFDCYGNRIGYGGGYYDRFLSENPVVSVGLCYERCKCTLIPAEEHDVCVNYVLSELYLRKTKIKEASVCE